MLYYRVKLILLFSAIVLAIASAIASTFGYVFDLKSHDFSGFCDDFNVFDIDFNLELKSCE